MGVCNQVTFLILYYPSSRLIPLLHIINAPKQVPDIVNLTVSFQFLNSSSQICLLFVPEMSASIPSYIVQIIYMDARCLKVKFGRTMYVKREY